MRSGIIAGLLALIGVTALTAPAVARGEWRQGGKLLLTGGVGSLEGAAGGGLASWAVIGGNETRDGIGGTAHFTYVGLDDYALTSAGAAIGLFDRLEISATRQRFDLDKVGAALGLGAHYRLGQDVFGAKLRLIGDAVYDQDRLLPQISIGVQHKRAINAPLLKALGARHAAGTDFYIAATKVLLAPGVVIDATMRLTSANQTGLLGFGGDRHGGRTAQFEGSIGKLLSRRLLVGAEYRTKPDNLGFAHEDDAFDLFAAYAIGHGLHLTAAYVDLGNIAVKDRQHGLFLSAQLGF